MNPKLVPYAFAIGCMIATLSLVQCGHSIYDHYANNTERTVSALLFAAFAIVGYLGYLLASVAVVFAVRYDLHRNSRNAAGCRYELCRIAVVLITVAFVQLWFFEAKDKAIVSGIASVLIYAYAMRIRHRMWSHPHYASKWFKIF